MAEYIRQDTLNEIENGKIIDANDLDAEFDAIVTALDKVLYVSFSTRPEFVIWATVNTPANGTIASDGTVLYKKVASSTAISDLNNWEPFGVIDPGHWGADYTGTTDSQPAFQSAVTYAAGKLVKTKKGGTLRIDTPVIATANNSCIDVRGTHIDATNFGHVAPTDASHNAWNGGRYRSVFEFRGTEGTNTTVASNISRWDRTISVTNATGISPGDHIKLLSDGEHWFTANSAENKYAVLKVIAVSGNTLTIADTVPISFDATSHTVSVFSWTPIKNPMLLFDTMDGGGKQDATLDNGYGPSGVFFEGYEDAVVEGREIKRFQNRAIGFGYGIGSRVSGVVCRGYADDDTSNKSDTSKQGFYGVVHMNSKKGLVERVTGHFTSHTVDSDGAEDMTYRDCVSNWDLRTGFTTHSGTNFLFENCSYYGQDSGWAWRGLDIKLVNCRSYSLSEDDKYCFYTAGSAASDVYNRIEIIGCEFYATGTPIFLQGNGGERFIISDCRITSGISETADPCITITGTNGREIRITGCEMIASGADECITITGALAGTPSVLIENNRFSGYTEYPVDITSSNTSIDVVAKNNRYDDESTVDRMVRYLSRVSGVWAVGDNFDTTNSEVDFPITPVVGTGTPTITFGGAAVGVTYTTQECVYERVGGRVIFRAEIELSSKGSSTGALSIDLNIGVGAAENTPISVYFSDVSDSSCDRAVIAEVVASSDNVRIAETSATTPSLASNWQNTHINNTSVIRLAGQYWAA